MHFPDLTRYFTGVLIPVSALRSAASIGIGEFADLPALGRWCRDAGLDLIQLLPVNDTGLESSPYSALSAFALHPVYLRIADLPELAMLTGDDRSEILKSLVAVRQEHADRKRIHYRELYTAKTALLRDIFNATIDASGVSGELQRFIEQTPWLREYAAFCMLKDHHDNRSWREWGEYRDPTNRDIDAIWADAANTSTLHFHAWVQWRADQQFTAAVAELAGVGILLKGDLPILMNEESADVWAHRELFITEEHAGAPPDMFSHLGQNWGLPIYNWDQLAATDFRWWKDRLRHAARYYSAYRIDHVLGFFRVWSISTTNYSGLLGRFTPSAAASRDRLHGVGLDDGRIRWLAEPHLPGNRIRTAFGEQAAGVIATALTQIGNEDIYLFADSIGGECDIQALELPAETREWLVQQFGDRALIADGVDRFIPTWSFRSSSCYQQLNDDERSRFETLVAELAAESELIWERQARELLGLMREATDMLPCAEDLGVVPRCVPALLAELRMLGLRIPRWSRLWDQEGQPYIPPSDYPFLTVCAPSVHDTSTMRGWWSEEADRQPFWHAIGFSGEPPDHYGPETARVVTAALLSTNSVLVVLQLQDLYALVDGIVPDDPDDERVNVPGTVNDINWSYRLELATEELSDHTELTELVSHLTAARRDRPVSAGR